jgi:hypothetical protein
MRLAHWRLAQHWALAACAEQRSGQWLLAGSSAEVRQRRRALEAGGSGELAAAAHWTLDCGRREEGGGGRRCTWRLAALDDGSD